MNYNYEEPIYIKLYSADAGYLASMSNRTTQVLYSLLKRAVFDEKTRGLVVYTNGALKRQIAETSGIPNVGTVGNSFTELVKGHVLKRLDTGCYMFNPYFFGYGEWEDVEKARELFNHDDIAGKSFRDFL